MTKNRRFSNENGGFFLFGSMSEEVTHSEAYTLQDIGLVVAALNKAV